MLLGTLGAYLLRTLLASKGVVRPGGKITRRGQKF